MVDGTNEKNNTERERDEEPWPSRPAVVRGVPEKSTWRGGLRRQPGSKLRMLGTATRGYDRQYSALRWGHAWGSQATA